MTTARLHQDLEIRSDAAVLYLAGELHRSDLPRLRAVCAQLPASVLMPCVDLHAVALPSPDSVRGVRAVLSQWRVRRGAGAFRLTLATSHLVACYREPCGTSVDPASWRHTRAGDDRSVPMSALI